MGRVRRTGKVAAFGPRDGGVGENARGGVEVANELNDDGTLGDLDRGVEVGSELEDGNEAGGVDLGKVVVGLRGEVDLQGSA